jgi:hypothetical protein
MVMLTFGASRHNEMVKASSLELKSFPGPFQVYRAKVQVALAGHEARAEIEERHLEPAEMRGCEIQQRKIGEPRG